MHAAQSDISPPAARRLLVVDDNEPSALTLTWAMELYGYDVRTCYDGQSALGLADEFHPRIILLDIGMPGMSGLEVCRQLRRNPSLKKLTVVAQTGWDDKDMRRRTADAGFDHHVTKPVDINALLKLIADDPTSE